MNTPPRRSGEYVPQLRPSIAGERQEVHAELDAFETSIDRFLDGKVPEASFLEFRLRHGVYGQRQDGVHMMRSKLPLGLLAPEQLESFADLTEAYTAGVAHLTTRQDIQVHFIPLKKTPDLMRVLAEAEMTSREACGNVVRNVCASEAAGVEPGEAFDVTPYGMALARFLLRHPSGQSLGRKFKITLAGSFDPYFNTGPIHDIGATAVIRDGVRGFHVVVGGGLGAVPHEAQLLTDFMPVAELFPTAVAMLRIFARHGEKKKRARARMKFLVAKWGIEKFREEVARERALLRNDELGTEFLENLGQWDDQPIHPPAEQFPVGATPEETTWLRTNVFRQKQAGYAAVRVRVPRGDLVPDQLRGLANLLRAHSGDTMRIAADQSLFIRWVPFDHLLELKAGLEALGLGQARAGGLGDTVTCPGSDSCKLGITSPRSVARHIEARIDALAEDTRLERLRIKISGCPNSCAQHQTADIGLYGATRTIAGRAAPHYMLYLGGRPGGMRLNAEIGGFGLHVGRVPALRVGEVVELLLKTFIEESDAGEEFALWVYRTGRVAIQNLIRPLTVLPKPDEDGRFYSEVGESEPFSIVRGVGECAGEVVLAADLLMVEADTQTERATQGFDEEADRDLIITSAREAMVYAARALMATQGVNEADPAHVVEAFKGAFYDTGRIYEGVGHYFLQSQAEARDTVVGDRLRRLVAESALFVEEAHTILAKMRATSVLDDLAAFGGPAS
ncbi:MAG: nitrite/sulfite reductase [Bradymonadia bacterium]